MRILLLSIFGSIIAFSHQQENPELSDAHWQEDLQSCLDQTGLDLSIFGVSRIDEVTEQHLKKLTKVPADKRGCLVACVFQKQGMISKEGVLQNNPPHPDPTTKFETTFEDAIAVCRAEENFCKLGNCLFGIYFNYEI
ncbi:venom protein O precursor [Nasonia vitripennis]|uniref:Putative odorant binding protein 19 n=1 Tax=Nasonia vitripennis TaxID=7425 RepID=G8B1M4_NASVI|nr:venom protein O precursor [Nasonia vitripennis]CCD17788.1 putative odorant binding protein 19 [Nasonia vitripennis]